MVIRCGAGFHRKAQGAFHKIKKLKERYLAKSDPKTKAWAQISGSLVCIQLFASKTQCLNFSRTGIGNMGFQMAGNVRRKMPDSATLHIYDVNDEACKRFEAKFGS